MNITLLALYRSRWANHIYQSRSNDGGQSWSAPQATELPNSNSSIQVTTLANGDLALVFNAMSAEGASERRTSLYDEIEDEEDDVAVTAEPVIHSGKTAFWGAPRAPLTLAISRDGGKSWPFRRHLDEGDGSCGVSARPLTPL